MIRKIFRFIFLIILLIVLYIVWVINYFKFSLFLQEIFPNTSTTILTTLILISIAGVIAVGYHIFEERF